MQKKRNNKPNLDILTKIKENHYQWCLDNGRNVSWYKKLKDFDLNPTTNLVRSLIKISDANN